MMVFKLLFDYLLAIILLPFVLPIVIILILISTLDTKKFGLFQQKRIGKNAEPFYIYKIRSMRGSGNSEDPPRVTKFGNFLREYKLDELPQLFNILLNQMSFVGPRPDLPGYADKLEGEDRIILTFKPGITGPAQLAYKNEEFVLSQQKDPLLYNDEVIWPDKVNINKEYIKKWSFSKDLVYLWKTLFFMFE